ncbi:hypothetical protein SAMN05421823_110254 [Catalinimonas alkaloidigena]|uniref:4-O-methyl-glucuronoyl methylesterase-like domain-containing protein n=1 Tax=Catalinimonas alkaloidigena TaxID=1075417 RepID=A0A1G9QPW6_9BACT|nr:acetylxylan esterase [Catalinimonas alkaloidigena]SDM13023.1 hypothetical protein SAMN05421823_110254 [Catalinimonas alkaloidigena]
MSSFRFPFLLLILLSSYATLAQEGNYDEAKVPPYTLPDPLRFENGKKVTTLEAWQQRRAEILELAEREMYGRMPGRPDGMRFTVFEESDTALGGKARRRQVRVSFTDDPAGPGMDLLLYVPADANEPVPVFLGLNFQGNAAIQSDPAIRLTESWQYKGHKGVVDNRMTEAARGATASRWPVEMIVERGYGVATIYCGDIDPDYDDGFKNGVQALYPDLQNRGDNFSTMAAWAWGLSRALDYLETDENVDAQKVMAFGFSRTGKAALWAGANDERFAMVISNESGAGGAALSKRIYGEDVDRLNRVFPHWFNQNFKKYSHREAALPFDQHEIIALIAPRPVYIASAEGDQGSDPRGEFLATQAASPVYELLGKKGLPAKKFPALHQPVMGTLGYHIRAGQHDVLPYDWQHFLDFADRQLK